VLIIIEILKVEKTFACGTVPPSIGNFLQVRDAGLEGLSAKVIVVQCFMTQVILDNLAIVQNAWDSSIVR
jgi:hypothetical protein